MRVFRHKGHNVYCITKNINIVKKKDKIKFWFGKLRFANFKLFIYPNRQWRYFHWLIMFPFFYWQKTNGGFQIGLPNMYLWRIK